MSTVTTLEWTYGPADWTATCASCGRTVEVGELALVTEDEHGDYLWIVCRDCPLATAAGR